jgi:predicted nucleic acid-binding protein
MLVVDASAVTELLLGRPAARAVEEQLRGHDFDLHAPHLLDVEVLSALRRIVAAGDASPDRAGDAVVDLLDLPLERYPHDGLAPRIWALRANFSAYDAAYVALAEAITDGGAPLLTADARLARAAGDHTELRVWLAEDAGSSG